MRIKNTSESRIEYWDTNGTPIMKVIFIKEAHLNEGEHRAYKIISLGNDVGLSPNSIMDEMRENGLTGEEMRAGAKAYKLEQQGFAIVGNSSNFKRKPRIKKIQGLQGIKINL